MGELSSMKKPVASLSLDLDDCWAFLKTHGNSNWSNFPTYFPTAIPRILNHLEGYHQKITFFIIGLDATFDYNQELLRSIADNGHEISNHSYHHDPWIQYFSYNEINEELAKAEEAIYSTTGSKVQGFRGPAFTFSPTLLYTLKERNYLYDASTLPNILNPLSRAYFFFNSNLKKEDLKKRGLVFGKWQDGFRPLKAYYWKLAKNQTLLEIPVTTFPILRFPIHMTYILYLSSYSKKLALTYFKTAATLCKLFNNDLSILLSPTDFLGQEDDHQIPFFPAMDLPTIEKIKVFDEVMSYLQAHFHVTTIGEHANIIAPKDNLKIKEPYR